MTSLLDRLVRPRVCLFGGAASAFRIFGLSGLALAVLVSAAVVYARGLSLIVLGGLVLTSVMTFVVLAMVTKIIVGEERLVYYHQEVAILATSGLYLWALGYPVLQYLDVTVLGVGTFLACGRIGCLLVGCCHGRPSSLGVRYRQEHADAGFTWYYVGVRLFPVQLVESLYVAGVVAFGYSLIFRGHPPGEALAWYVIAYDIGRFSFEFLRGDPDRPYYQGFSEGQWTSVVLMGLVVWAELTGVITYRSWHVAATAGMVVAMAAITVSRRFGKASGSDLLSPRHVREVVDAIDRVADPVSGTPVSSEGADAAEVVVGRTSQGILISCGTVKYSGTPVALYSLSSRGRTLTEAAARNLADLIAKIRHQPAAVDLLAGRHGVYHVLLRPPGDGPS